METVEQSCDVCLGFSVGEKQGDHQCTRRLALHSPGERVFVTQQRENVFADDGAIL